MPTSFPTIEWKTATPQQILAAYTKEVKTITVEEYRKLGIVSWAHIRGLDLEANMGIMNNITIRNCMYMLTIQQHVHTSNSSH
jgi:hypothetical protein